MVDARHTQLSFLVVSSSTHAHAHVVPTRGGGGGPPRGRQGRIRNLRTWGQAWSRVVASLSKDRRILLDLARRVAAASEHARARLRLARTPFFCALCCACCRPSRLPRSHSSACSPVPLCGTTAAHAWSAAALRGGKWLSTLPASGARCAGTLQNLAHRGAAGNSAPPRSYGD